MRRRWSSQQRLWMGTRRYLCRGRRGHTDADAHCYSDGDRHANCQPYRNGNGYAATDPNAQVGANGKAASHASSQAIEIFASAKFSSDQ
jgi:hypothetical protein